MIAKYHSFSHASDFVNNHAIRPFRIILGNDEKYWVVTPREAEKLIKQGFEYA